jgi:hypothetical protein
MTKNPSIVEVRVVSYDEGTDTFKIDIPCPGTIPGSMNDQLDYEFFDMPAGLFAILVGEYDEPFEFVGKNFTLQGKTEVSENDDDYTDWSMRQGEMGR